ncbi:MULTISPECIES: copper resistance D family protein [unclassified Exiguobacterium]|uniref:copper resistance D family protein n=1 Tax=unclassified Exiguobacterium TaxID=2644629 RepID=UPI001BEBEB48|nr:MULTISPECIES: CopD family protein [unclassified Exiguobacterium]
MIFLYLIGDTLLYGSLTLLIGYFSIQLIPLSYRPDISFSVRRIRALILLTPLFFSFSVIRIVLYLYEDIGLWMTLQSVLFTFEAGNAWILMTLWSVLLLIFTNRPSLSPGRVKLSMFFLLLMVGTFAWSGHASSIKGAEGMIIHTAHALAVFIWTGGLLVLGFSSKSDRNLAIILEWFRPLVTLCFLIIVGSGIYLMSVVVSVGNYLDSWILPYGQALLWKHVLILPVLVIGFLNGKWSYAHSKQSFEVQRMRMRVEGLLMFLLFTATAWLGQQEPPHSIKDTLKSSGAGTLSEFLFPSLRFTYSSIRFEPTVTTISLMTISLLFSGLLIFVIRTTSDSVKILFLGLGASLSLFFAFLYSISIFL